VRAYKLHRRIIIDQFRVRKKRCAEVEVMDVSTCKRSPGLGSGPKCCVLVGQYTEATSDYHQRVCA
jgi:hypothetical protein